MKPLISTLREMKYLDIHILTKIGCLNIHFTQSRYNMIIDNSTSKLIKTINNCKRNRIRIVNSLDDIKISSSLLAGLEKVKKKNEELKVKMV